MMAFQSALLPSWPLDSVLSLHPDAVQLELGMCYDGQILSSLGLEPYA